MGRSTGCVPAGGGFQIKPSTATLTKARHESLAVITCLDTWSRLDIGLKPRMTCTAQSCPSRCRKISDLKTLFSKSKFTKPRLLVVTFLSKERKEIFVNHLFKQNQTNG